jgi:hypothetical protein
LTASQSAAIGAVIAAFTPSSASQFSALAGLVTSLVGSTISNGAGIVRNALGSASNYIPSTSPPTYINGVKNGDPYFTGAVAAGGIALGTAAVAGGLIIGPTATTTGPATTITSYDENNQRMRMNIGATRRTSRTRASPRFSRPLPPQLTSS